MKQSLLLVGFLMLSLQSQAADRFQPIEGSTTNCTIAPEAIVGSDRLTVTANFEFQVCVESKDGDQITYRLEKREGGGLAIAMESTGLNVNAARAEAMNQCVQKNMNVKAFSYALEDSLCAGLAK